MGVIQVVMNQSIVEEHIEEYGWHFQFVFDEAGKKQDFSYSIGFEKSFGHPDVMIFGLKRETMHSILTDLAQDLKNGSVFPENERVKNVLSNDYDVIFKPVKSELLGEYAGIAKDYYGKPFKVLVMFWPDRNNILPTEPGCELTVQSEALEIV